MIFGTSCCILLWIGLQFGAISSHQEKSIDEYRIKLEQYLNENSNPNQEQLESWFASWSGVGNNVDAEVERIHKHLLGLYKAPENTENCYQSASRQVEPLRQLEPNVDPGSFEVEWYAKKQAEMNEQITEEHEENEENEENEEHEEHEEHDFDPGDVSHLQQKSIARSNMYRFIGYLFRYNMDICLVEPRENFVNKLTEKIRNGELNQYQHVRRLSEIIRNDLTLLGLEFKSKPIWRKREINKYISRIQKYVEQVYIENRYQMDRRRINQWTGWTEWAFEAIKSHENDDAEAKKLTEEARSDRVPSVVKPDLIKKQLAKYVLNPCRELVDAVWTEAIELEKSDEPSNPDLNPEGYEEYAENYSYCEIYKIMPRKEQYNEFARFLSITKKKWVLSPSSLVAGDMSRRIRQRSRELSWW